MLEADVIVGGFFGDEGKGKYVGRVGHGYHAVLRVNASTNAGHCVREGDRTFVTRQLPSVFFPGETELVVGPGALLNLTALAEEVQGRPDLPALRGRVRVASSVALVLPVYQEKGRGGQSERIGSTHQGTGPTAVARAARHALHLYDVQAAARDEGARGEVLGQLAITCEETLPRVHRAGAPETRARCEEMLAGLLAACAALDAALGPGWCVDYTAWLRAAQAGPARRVLIEGCNGLLLDNLHGAQPHTTSASTNVGALLCGANLPPACARRVVVVVAAYATCLGKRPFPTEMAPAEAAHVFAHCDEVDPAELLRRRIGWLDVPGLRKALAGSQGATLHMNKLDVLSGLEQVLVCEAYEVDGRVHDAMPDDPRLAARARPVYRALPGWREPLGEVRAFEDLPANARAYVRAVEALLPNPIASVGVGPRNQDVLEVPPARPEP